MLYVPVQWVPTTRAANLGDPGFISPKGDQLLRLEIFVFVLSLFLGNGRLFVCLLLYHFHFIFNYHHIILGAGIAQSV
jgi:hypothetical protein